MSELQFVVTDAGRAAIVNLPNTGADSVIVAQIGVTATAFTANPDGSDTALPGELKRLSTIAGVAVSDDTIHVTIQDDSADTYSLRGFALYLDDGTLFGLYGQADVIVEKSTQASMLLSSDIKFTQITATDIAFGDTGFANPPASTTVVGVTQYATNAEALSGAANDKSVVASALKYVLDSRFGAGAPSAFVKGLLTLATAALVRTALELGNSALKNMGSGNGLDADLLDGQHGDYYRAWANLTGVPSLWGPGNDGSGSGLDADLLDGQHGSYYAADSEVLHTTGAETFSGIKTALGRFEVAGGDAKPKVILQPSGVGRSGYVDFIDDDGATRAGYMGYANSETIQLYAVAGRRYDFNGGNGPTVSGNVIWHAGNFNPASKADDSGVVHKTGDENVGGVKTYTDSPVITAQQLTLRGTSDRLVTFLDGDGHTRGMVFSVAASRALVMRSYNADASAYKQLAISYTGSFTWDGKTVWHAGSEYITIGSQSGGGVGQLRIEDAAAARISWTATGSRRWSAGNSGQNWTLRDESGTVNCLTVSPTTGALAVNGAVTAPSFQTTSSRAVKRDIIASDYGLRHIEMLQPVEFEYKDDSEQRRRIGLIAEDAAHVVPHAVFAGSDGVPAIDYPQMIPVLISAIQQLAAEVRELRSLVS